MPRPNWFFAFPLDGSFMADLPELPAGLRRYHPEDVHLTLAFLGGCGEEAALRALAALDERLLVAPLKRLEVTLGDVVAMGSRPYSALSALLGRGRAEATAYLASTRDVLSEAALGRREKRAPKPHVTIARPVPRASDTQRAAGLSWAQTLQLGAVERTLERVALYTWHENRRERLFRIVAERALV